MARHFRVIRLFDSLFLEDSEGDDHDDGLLGQTKATTVYTYRVVSDCLSSLSLEKQFCQDGKRYRPRNRHVSQAFVVYYGETEAYNNERH